MRSDIDIHGIHHITAITNAAAENLAFYEQILGLRLVKQTVNFDDPTTYHLYYGDAAGTPGTILTFFPWEGLPRGRQGAGMVTAVGFAIPDGAIDFWMARLRSHGVKAHLADRFGAPVIRFSDPHGLPLELTGVAGPSSVVHWEKGPVEPAYALGGFHAATATLTSDEQIRPLLTDHMGMQLQQHAGHRFRFSAGGLDAPGPYYDILIDPTAPAARPGSGTVHHIAFRAADAETLAGWQATLRRAGFAVTEQRDRKYFRSIYFPTPGGVLFEIATDPPGFGVDEAVHQLGTSLMLPDALEVHRRDIEKQLPVLRPYSYTHLYEVPQTTSDGGETLVTLHGTGGNERDLIPLARSIQPAAAILSPRGDVSENGMARFFTRLANNVFDEADIARRVDTLADFITAAIRQYDRKPDRLTAMGYSNGANMAAAILLLRPEVFAGAVLLRPMLPLQHLTPPDLKGKPILVLRGSRDRVIPADSTDRLISVLVAAGARVTTRSIDAGHEITQADIDAATRWVAQRLAEHAPYGAEADNRLTA
ncbi:MAG: VOC family protein [Desulfosarcinaceae bacterium]|nr:VOC family protein [Desulfosarcinaceae bacterium]